MSKNLFISIVLMFSMVISSCCLDISNNFKEINPKNLKFNTKELVIKLNCGSLFELYVDEGAFGGHENYIFESITGKVFYLSNAYLHNTDQQFVFNPVDSSIVYFDKDDNQIWPTKPRTESLLVFKKIKGHIVPIDSININTSGYVEKIFRLNDDKQLEPYLDLSNEFSWSFDDGIYLPVGYPGVFMIKN
ncbi:MAG: hypothetical protein IPL53_25120 [Ignavibacteria bacterium]|nr:hypothetical protein [Ignavibacteria bacterium]